MQPVSRPMWGLARLTLLEARRTAVGKAALGAMTAALFLALFASRIVLVDQERVTVVAYAVIVRLALVFTLASGDHRQHGARSERADRRSLPRVAVDAHAIRDRQMAGLERRGRCVRTGRRRSAPGILLAPREGWLGRAALRRKW